MSVANPREVPEYELNPLELQVRKSDGISKVCFLFLSCFYLGRFCSLTLDYQLVMAFLTLKGAFLLSNWLTAIMGCHILLSTVVCITSNLHKLFTAMR